MALNGDALAVLACAAQLSKPDGDATHFDQMLSHFENAGSALLAQGISVVIPAYQAERHLRNIIAQLAAQTLDPKLFEILVIVNGNPAGSEGVLLELTHQYPFIELRWYFLDLANAGAARNLGVQLARRQYITFIDADDGVGNRFLEEQYRLADDSTVVVSPIRDVSDDGIETDTNYIQNKMRGVGGKSLRLIDAPWVIGFNACKLIATQIARTMTYPEHLSSGEDVAFWAQALRFPNLKLIFVDMDLPEAAYLRTLTRDSVSRQEESFEFDVQQRLDCIGELRVLGVPLEAQSALDSRIRAQAGFISRYITRHPKELPAVRREVTRRGIYDFPWDLIPREKPDTLVFSYCFPPYSDTSAIVAAKVIAQQAHMVDVIANEMRSARTTDVSTELIASSWVDRVQFIDSVTSFANWQAISQFAQQAAALAGKWNRERNYQRIYSRALWIGSHVAALLYKIRHPHAHWQAEFSDPLRTNALAEQRIGSLQQDVVSAEIASALRRDNSCRGCADTSNLFNFIEYATMQLADELIFTNHNQLEIMAAPYPAAFQEEIKRKAIVRAHPQPQPELYRAVEPRYVLDPEAVNIGYFGNFYGNRGMDELLPVMSEVNHSMPSRDASKAVCLHIFTNNGSLVQAGAEALGIAEYVRVNPYVPYVEFLALCKTFDVLLVNDAVTRGRFSVNPFLPSKLSDYLGSGTDIWSVVEEGSPAAEVSTRYRSFVGDEESMRSAIKEIVATKN
ncbi:MAG: glycosyltransferase [Actinomycetaceae bacterium]|nr:glycosyltransferase [Arcanobacterium sp.]MDD7504729.1 glycosyltransferase [Actinomycetaceae bacterium]MDY6143096.1 glycosyltransferase [Arcanobacterium sp.]